MKAKIKIFGLIGAVALLASCANYNHISENDVYFQKPTELALDEDETDITSFNAFNARQKGFFRDEYNDPRLNQRSMANNLALRASYMPFGMPYGGPMAFHGMGYNSFYGYSSIYNRRYGYGYGMGGFYGSYYPGGGAFANPFYYDMYTYGSPYYYSPYNYGYTNHYGYNPYYYGGGYYGGGYSGGYYTGAATGNEVTYYGQRSAGTSASTRSSNYENTLKKKQVTTSNIYNTNQTVGTSRRASGATVGGTTGTGTNTSTKPITGTTKATTNYRSTTVNRRSTVNTNYSPNTSSQRSGVVNTRRTISTSPARGGNTNARPATQRSTTPVAPRTNTQSRQQQPAFSTGSSNRGTTTPSGTTRSSGNSGRR